MSFFVSLEFMTGYQEIHRLMRLDFRKMGRGRKPINIKALSKGRGLGEGK